MGGWVVSTDIKDWTEPINKSNYTNQALSKPNNRGANGHSPSLSTSLSLSGHTLIINFSDNALI